MSVALFLPVESATGALAFAAGIETGRIPCLREYLDEHLARENFAKYPGGRRKLLGIFRVENGVATRVAGAAEREAIPPAPPVSMTERRDGVRVSGEPITERAGRWNGSSLAMSTPLGDRSLGGQEARHVA